MEGAKSKAFGEEEKKEKPKRKARTVKKTGEPKTKTTQTRKRTKKATTKKETVEAKTSTT